MIEDSEIAAFPEEKQVAICKEIDAYVKAGVDARYLILLEGKVVYDVITEGDDIVADFFKKRLQR